MRLPEHIQGHAHKHPDPVSQPAEFDRLQRLLKGLGESSLLIINSRKRSMGFGR
jgi:hypothetical protein